MAKLATDPMPKPEAREHGYAVRMGLTAHEQALLDERIFVRLQKGWDWSTVERVHIYLPLAKRREIGTWALVRWLWAAHPSTQIYVPRLTATGMDHVEVTHDTRFRPNQYRIPEPMSGRMLGAGDRLDMIITPLLAFDLAGHRVGYGGGYYDRFLTEHPEAERVGLAYSDCLLEQGILAEAHDMPLQVIVTEDEIRRVAS